MSDVFTSPAASESASRFVSESSDLIEHNALARPVSDVFTSPAASVSPVQFKSERYDMAKKRSLVSYF